MKRPSKETSGDSLGSHKEREGIADCIETGAKGKNKKRGNRTVYKQGEVVHSKWKSREEDKLNQEVQLNTITRNRKRKTGGRKDKFSIKLINIQGFSKTKIVEVEKLLENSNDVLCLTETQHKVDRLNLNDNIIKHTSMRDLTDKKGGG